MRGLRTTALVFSAFAVACGGRPAVAPIRSPTPDLVVLLPGPAGEPTGQASVANQAGRVELEGERAATRIVQGAAPTPAVTMSEAEINRLFGETIASIPLPPQSFLLYFQFESDDLIDESRARLPEVLRAFGAYPAPEVVVIGHTDTTGDAAGNAQLGLTRANAVRQQLVGIGIDASVIQVESHGEADPLVRTPDDTAEPRNRRVEISIR